MNNCKLCAALEIGPNKDIGLLDKPKEHANVHQRQLQIIIGQKVLVEEMMEKCSGVEQEMLTDVKKENTSEMVNIRPRVVRKNKNCPISNVCYEIYEKHGCQKILTCCECGFELVVRTDRFESRRMKDHACIHLDKDLFECRFCDYKSSHICAINGHLINIHKLSAVGRNYINHTTTYEADIIHMIRRCFGDPTVKPVKKPWVIKTTPISTFCRQLLSGRNRNEKVPCSLCGRQFSLLKKRSPAIVEHALTHLDQKPFQCKMCVYSVVRKDTLINHLIRVHQRECTDETCNDLTEKYQDDIKAMITRCFGDVDDGSTVNKSGAKNWATKHRLKKLYDRLFQHRNRNEKAQCSKCKARIPIHKTTISTVDHARGHMHKIMFSCKICDFGCTKQRSIRDHIRRAHRITMTNNFIDSTADFEQEILDMMTECFGHN